MTKKLGVVMDPIGSINYKKDSTLAMLLEAARRGWTIYYFEQKDLFLRDGLAFGKSKLLNVFQDQDHWFEFGAEQETPLASLNLILMRKDPPFDREYIYTTYILEQAERHGTLVANKSQSLRDANEKLFTAWFPACCPPTLVTRSHALLREFFHRHQDIICKPLDGMGGTSIFHLQPGDPNASVVFETLTGRETQYMMAQRFIPEITAGDKRILLIDGDPIPFALARIPGKGEWRGNLAAGARGVAQPLTARDRWICEQVGPVLREKGLYFVGIDVIGDFLTEINVTSPTCIRELDEQCNLNISEILFDCLEKYLQ
jgi:glutathione synthase